MLCCPRDSVPWCCVVLVVTIIFGCGVTVGHVFVSWCYDVCCFGVVVVVVL